MDETVVFAIFILQTRIFKLLNIDEIELFTVYFLSEISKKVTKPRGCWVYQINAVRETEGDLNVSYPHFEKDPKNFLNYFRTSITTFEELLTVVQSELTKQNSTLPQKRSWH